MHLSAVMHATAPVMLAAISILPLSQPQCSCRLVRPVSLLNAETSARVCRGSSSAASCPEMDSDCNGERVSIVGMRKARGPALWSFFSLSPDGRISYWRGGN